MSSSYLDISPTINVVHLTVSITFNVLITYDAVVAKNRNHKLSDDKWMLEVLCYIRRSIDRDRLMDKLGLRYSGCAPNYVFKGKNIMLHHNINLCIIHISLLEIIITRVCLSGFFKPASVA